MGIQKNQTAARLILQTDVDFNGATVTEQTIFFLRPDGTAGSWAASILTGGEALGKIYFDFTATDYFNQSGVWVLWAYLKFSDNRTATGEHIEYSVGP